MIYSREIFILFRVDATNFVGRERPLLYFSHPLGGEKAHLKKDAGTVYRQMRCWSCRESPRTLAAVPVRTPNPDE